MTQTRPLISVIVPFRDNEDDLADCLDSIAAQTHRELDVIMVDDGSVDGGAAIAQARTARDSRFRLLRLTDGGSPGYARNRGLEMATGEFLAFADGDDLVPANAYELMVHTLERSGSDLVSGQADRLGPKGVNPSMMHALAIKGRQTGTHISRTPRLLYDATVWNTMFRRSFWDKNKLSFPEGMVFEDIQLMTMAYVLAGKADVIPDVVYIWRERVQGGGSITQRRGDVANLRDRVAALANIDEFLAAQGQRALRRAHQRKALKNDLWLYVGELHKVTPAYRAEFGTLVGDYLAHVDRRVPRSLPATHKLAYYLVRRGALDQLAQYAAWLMDQPVRQAPLVRQHGRLVADLPFLRTGLPSGRVPRRVYRPHWRDLDPYMQVDDVQWQGDRLVVAGRANVPSIDVSRRRHTSKVVLLRPSGRRMPRLVRVRSFDHPEATALSEQDRYNYDWSGFRFAVRPGSFRQPGTWQAYMLVRGRTVWRPARVHTPVPGRAEHPAPRDVAVGLRFGARWAGLGLNLATWRTTAVLRAVARVRPAAGPGAEATPDPAAGQNAGESTHGCDNQPPIGGWLPQPSARLALELVVEVAGGTGGSAEVLLVRSRGAATRSVPAARAETATATATATATTTRTATTTATQRYHAEITLPLGDTDGESQWDVHLRQAGRARMRVAWPDGMAERRLLAGDREVAVGRSRYGDLVISERTPRPVIQEYQWDGSHLLLRGSFLGAAGASAGAVGTTGASAGAGTVGMASAVGTYEAVLRLVGGGAQHAVPFSLDQDQFTIDVDVERMPFFGEQIPLRDGDWKLYIKAAGSAEVAELKYDHDTLEKVSGEKIGAGHKRYRFLVTGHDDPMITAEAALSRIEQGNYAQRALRRGYYPLAQKAPLRDQVLFISWKGKQCGDNPLGIAAELSRRGDKREHLWVVNDWATPVPENGIAVLRGTKPYFDALARSAWIVANDDMTAPFRKRDGQFYLQTWHGTPLKRIGFDIENPQFLSGTAYFDHLANDVKQWDLLVSPNPFSTPLFRQAFRYEGEIAETGYPRDDVLSRAGAAERARQVRARLGLPEGKKIALYAPTWRDNQVYASGKRYRFDLRLDLEQAWKTLGDDWAILVRGHHQSADDVPAGMRPGFALNVSAYPDITDLYLVSDVLVTDYSSAMFDFAVTGRPMVFFTYDLADYRDNLRGFYFDFEAEAPGPLLATSTEVTDALAGLDTASAPYRERYKKFQAKFCPLDDGEAASRICDRLFGQPRG